MKKLFVLLFMMTLTLPLANAILEKPQWKPGYYWKYHITPDGGNLTFKIESKEKIEVNNESYEVFNISQTSDRGEKRITYVRTTDFAILKEIDFYDSKRVERIYSPPTQIFKYDIDVGDFYIQSYKILEYYGKKLISEKQVNVQAMCVAKTNVDISLGKYECYKVVENRTYSYGQREDKNTYTFYHSPDLGNWIKMTANNGKIEIYLFETNYGQNKSPFPFAMLFISFLVLIFLKRIYK